MRLVRGNSVSRSPHSDTSDYKDETSWESLGIKSEIREIPLNSASPRCEEVVIFDYHSNFWLSLKLKVVAAWINKPQTRFGAERIISSISLKAFVSAQRIESDRIKWFQSTCDNLYRNCTQLTENCFGSRISEFDSENSVRLFKNFITCTASQAL